MNELADQMSLSRLIRFIVRALRVTRFLRGAKRLLIAVLAVRPTAQPVATDEFRLPSYI